MPLGISTTAKLHWWLKHFKNVNKSLYDTPVDCTIQKAASV